MRYSFFMRSGATVSLVILYLFTTLFSPSFAAAEEVARESNHEELTTQDFQNNENLEDKTPDTVSVEDTKSDSLDTSFEEDVNTDQEVSSEEITPVVSEDGITFTPESMILVCEPASSPVITFQSVYADQQPGGVYSLVAILTQIGAEATDAEDGVVSVENNLASLFPFTSGWHEVTFTAQDSDGCVTTDIVDIFIFGNDYTPSCPFEDVVYLKAQFPLDLETALGTNSYIFSEQWFPVVYGGGLTLDESEFDITVPHDISVVRAGTSLFVNVNITGAEGEAIALAIKDSLQVVGGTILSADVFSGNVLVVNFEQTDVVCEDPTPDPEPEPEPEDEDSSSSSSGSRKRKTQPEGEVLGDTACTPYITTFMKMGEANVTEDVIRLQTFLNEYMGENLVVDGVYGPATFEAVKRFQVQEFDEILAPWGITEPTGITRETTTRHINNIMCPELNIAMPILYCATTGNLIYPDGTIVDPDPEYILYNGQPIIKTWVVAPQSVLGDADYQYEK